MSPVLVISSSPARLSLPYTVPDSIVGGGVFSELSANFCLGVLPLESFSNQMAAVTHRSSRWESLASPGPACLP